MKVKTCSRTFSKAVIKTRVAFVIVGFRFFTFEPTDVNWLEEEHH